MRNVVEAAMRKFMLTCLCCVLAMPSLRADERYFVVLFASQGPNGDARRTHTFATFLKVDIGEPDEDGEIPTQTMETTTISWLPASGSIRVLAPSEVGRNFGLQETLEWAKDNGTSTSARGPFEITREIYERAVKQKQRLESGAVAYKVIDRRFRTGAALNCIHAVSDIIPGSLLMSGTARGESATDMVAQHFRPHLPDPGRTHSWAVGHLDLNGERIVVQNEPGTRAVSTPIFAE